MQLLPGGAFARGQENFDLLSGKKVSDGDGAGLPKECCDMVIHRAAGAWQRAEKQ